MGLRDRFEPGTRGEWWISETTGERGEMGETEKPEFPDKEVTPEEIRKAETDKTLREVKEVNDKNKSDVKEQEPTEIPSKEQTPGTKD